jgi:hypothetical protein
MSQDGGAATKKLQVTVDAATERVIGEIAKLGIHGTSHSEVACSILRMWIWENEQRLRENGVTIRPMTSERSRR